MSLHSFEPNPVRSRKEVVKDIQEIVADVEQHIAVLGTEYTQKDCCVACHGLDYAMLFCQSPRAGWFSSTNLNSGPLSYKCVCVCACVRACVRAHTGQWFTESYR
jgi:hypothetical protein